ncbi:hypothetical protein [Streptomyces sp. NPDC056817]|uniref:hypothetical protein n=1 Tax=Streptomyces sp. NPDC056817 TaxID=3345950 RepID=UPI0036A067B5
MPFNVEIWVDDDPGRFTIYIDKKLITERGATTLEGVLRKHIRGWQRVDEGLVYRVLRAITG